MSYLISTFATVMYVGTQYRKIRLHSDGGCETELAPLIITERMDHAL